MTPEIDKDGICNLIATALLFVGLTFIFLINAFDTMKSRKDERRRKARIKSIIENDKN